MVAFPTCFPGVTVPIPADESRIAAIDVAEDGNVYGGTSGRRTHLFVGMFKGVTGAIFDLGVVEDATSCTAVCCGKDRFVAAVNGSAGGRLVTQELQPLPFDLIQEWGFERKPFQDLGPVSEGEKILHAVTDPTGRKVVGVSENHVFSLDLEELKVEVVGEVKGSGRISCGCGDLVYGLDESNTLWTYGPSEAKFSRKAVPLPEGDWGGGAHRWANDPHRNRFYLADCSGRLFCCSKDQGFSEVLAEITPLPVGAMAVTGDGRVFGACGEGIGRLFCYSPKGDNLRDLGCAVSVIERRRYGYVFADAAVGRDGEIILAENDDLGHLWLYFPKIEAP